MGTHAISIRNIDNGVAVHDPVRIAVDVGALGDVIDLHRPVGLDDANVTVRITHVAHQGQHEPFRVGRPFIREAVVVGFVMLAAVGNLTHLLALYIIDFQYTTVLDEGNLLTVRRIGRGDALHPVVVEQRLLVDQGRIHEVEVLLALDGGLIEVPIAIPFGGVHQAAAVFGERGVALGLRGMRHLLGGVIVIGACDEDLAARAEGDQLAVLAQVEVADAFEVLLHQLFKRLVVDDLHRHLLRLLSDLLGVDLPHITIAQGAVVGHAQESHRVSLEGGHLLHLLKVLGRGLIYVEIAVVALAEEDHLVVPWEETRIAVLSHIGGHQGMGLLLGVVVHDVTGNGGDMMFAPDVLAAFPIIIEERLPVLVERHARHGHGNHLFGTSTFDAHLIEFRDPSDGELDVLGLFLDLGREIDLLPIGREGQRRLRGGVGRDATGHAAFHRHGIHIEVSIAVGGEGDGLAVGRPDRTGLVGSIGRELLCSTALDVDDIHIPLVAEGNLVPLVGDDIVAHPQRVRDPLQRQRENQSK